MHWRNWLLAVVVGCGASLAYARLPSDSLHCGEPEPDHFCLNERNARRAREFLTDVPAGRQAQILSMVDRLNRTDRDWLPLTEGAANPARPVLVFVQGLYVNEGTEWFEPLHWVWERGYRAYFIRFRPFDSLDQNAERVVHSLLRIALEIPNGGDLRVFAYSAGGIPAVQAWRYLHQRYLLPPTWQLHTMAAPVGGYAAPEGLSEVLVPFLGRSVQEIGVGQERRFAGYGILPRCVMHLTTSCRADAHACPRGEGLTHETIPEMPCRTLSHPGEVNHQRIIVETLEHELLGYPLR